MPESDETFAADWLALRAGADRRARNAGLAARLSRHFAARAGLFVLDLGAGTGAMLRATAPLLGPAQRWRLVDADAGLLARIAAPAGVAFASVTADLAGEMAPLFQPAPDLVTCSALLDLCSADWLDRLVAHLAASGAAFHAILSYDGRAAWSPAHALDVAILDAFHADQRRDKGLGPALGPGAPAHLVAALRAAGYEVLTAPADWHLAPPEDVALIAALAESTAHAAGPALGPAAAAWGRARAGATAVTIGHTDLLALPPGR